MTRGIKTRVERLERAAAERDYDPIITYRGRPVRGSELSDDQLEDCLIDLFAEVGDHETVALMRGPEHRRRLLSDLPTLMRRWEKFL